MPGYFFVALPSRLGSNAANQLYPGSTTAKNEAMRYCVASATLAVSSGCGPAECIGTQRENWQNDMDGQAPRDGIRAKNNNRVGRECAGCTGSNAQTDPGVGSTFYPPYPGLPVVIEPPPPTTSARQILSCCQKAIEDGTADIGP